jgi:hypothetical protein
LEPFALPNVPAAVDPAKKRVDRAEVELAAAPHDRHATLASWLNAVTALVSYVIDNVDDPPKPKRNVESRAKVAKVKQRFATPHRPKSFRLNNYDQLFLTAAVDPIGGPIRQHASLAGLGRVRRQDRQRRQGSGADETEQAVQTASVATTPRTARHLKFDRLLRQSS